MFKRSALLVALCIPHVAFAGSGSGRVTSIFIANDTSVVLFKLDGPLEDSPGCNKGERFAIQTAGQGGRNLYRAVLEAKAHDYTIAVKGLNTCVYEWKSEDVKNIEIR